LPVADFEAPALAFDALDLDALALPFVVLDLLDDALTDVFFFTTWRRAWRSGRFQSTALSARNAAGMASMPSP
jgi:hypothetical protein